MLLIFPSFQLARLAFQKPEFVIPAKLEVGDILAFDAGDDIESLVAGGRPMRPLKNGETFVAPVAKAGAFEVSFTYKKPAVGRMHVEFKKPDHPSASYFRTRIPVSDPAVEAALVAEAAERARIEALPPKERRRHEWAVAWRKSNAKPELKTALPSGERPWPAKLEPRTEFAAELACWREPSMRLLEQEDAARKRNSVGRHFRLAAVSAAGAGEVMFSGNAGDSGRTVIVYHGSSLYTRYQGLQETLVSKGAKIKVGQEVGLMAAGTLREPTTLKWEARMSGVTLNPKKLLDLSSRLCGSK